MQILITILLIAIAANAVLIGFLHVATSKPTPEYESLTQTHMKIYISGKITGLEPTEYKANFEAAEQELIEAGIPAENIVNPCKLGIPENGSWGEAMKVCLKAMDDCTAIYMLRNWQDSIGARRELNHAGMRSMHVYFESACDANMIADYLIANKAASIKRYYLRFTPDTESLYIAESETGYPWNILQGDEARKLHQTIQQKIDSATWREAQKHDEKQSEINERAAAARLFE